jgi:hypothetical protein
MKERLDRYQERLTEAEWERFRANLRLKLEGSARRSEITLRRWVFSSALAAVTVVAAGILVTVTERHAKVSRPGHLLQLVPSAKNAMVSGPAGAEQVGTSAGQQTDPPAYRTARRGPAGVFNKAAEESLSTFPLAIGSASYQRARGAILRGTLPGPDQVLVEEFVNAFPQDYPRVRDADLGIFMDAAPSPFTRSACLLRVGIKARARDPLADSTTAPEEGSRTVAENARAEVSFAPDNVESYRLLGFEGTVAAAATGAAAPPGSGGFYLRPGQEATALYEVRLRPGPASGRLVSVRVHYAALGADGAPEGPPRELRRDLLRGEVFPSFLAAPPRLRCDAAAAEFARILRGPAGVAGQKLHRLLPQVRRLVAQLGGDAKVLELAVLVERSAGLAGRD